MTIIDLQRKWRELGRIRMGEVIVTAKGKQAPAKLDHFRITSQSERLIQKVADLYGGTPTRWTPQGSTDAQWQVTVTADRIPVMLPPQSINQSYELWSGGGCVRRCDGEREEKSDKPCLCSPDPARRECTATTRLNVILREVPGLGVWRLESHGYYAAAELPQVAEFLEYAGQYVEAYLVLEKRKDIKDGKTRHWLTPALDVDHTPAQMVAAAAAAGQLGPADQRAITPPTTRAALTSGPTPPPGPTVIDPDSVAPSINACETPDALRDLWRELSRDHALDDPRNAAVAAAFQARAKKIKPPEEGAPKPDGATPPPAMETDPETEQLWNQILTLVPKDQTSDAVDEAFTAAVGVAPEAADADQLRSYLADLQAEGTP